MNPADVAKPAPRRSIIMNTPWYYGWNVLGAAVLFQAITWGIVATFTMFVPAWMSEFNASRADVMMAILLEMIVIGLLAPPVGRLLDRMTIGLLVASGGFFFACGLLLIAVATELWHVLLAYGFFLAVGKSVSGPLTGSTLAANWFRRRKGRALGISATGTAVGSVVLAPLIAFSLEMSGWRTTHVALAVASIAILVPLGIFVVRSSPESAGIEAEMRGLAGGSQPQPSRKWTTMEILSSPVLWIVVAAVLPFNLITSAVQSNLSPFLQDLGFGIKDASRLIPLMAAMTIAGKIALGTLSDRFDTRSLLLVAVALMASALLILRLAPAMPLLYFGAALMGFAAGAPLPLIGIIIADNFERSAFGRVTGVVFFFVLTFSGTGAVVGGYLRDVTGSYLAMFTALLVLLAPVAIAAAFLKTRRKGSEGAT